MSDFPVAKYVEIIHTARYHPIIHFEDFANSAYLNEMYRYVYWKKNYFSLISVSKYLENYVLDF